VIEATVESVTENVTETVTVLVARTTTNTTGDRAILANETEDHVQKKEIVTAVVEVVGIHLVLPGTGSTVLPSHL
jgi:hypothetical protein